MQNMTSTETILLRILNTVLSNNDLKEIKTLHPDASLQSDLEMDSIILAELTVRIEDEFDVDVFENGMVHTVKDILILLGKE